MKQIPDPTDLSPEALERLARELGQLSDEEALRRLREGNPLTVASQVLYPQADLRRLSGALTGHHSIDLGGGVVTPSSKSFELNRREAAAFFDPVLVVGASMLGIWAWNGFYSFEAKRRRASRVVASDSYAWNDTNFRGRETFDLAWSALGVDVEPLNVDAMELDPTLHGSLM